MSQRSNSLNSNPIDIKTFLLHRQLVELAEWSLAEEIRADVDLLVLASKAYMRVSQFDKVGYQFKLFIFILELFFYITII
jgi:hypothetical protein